MLPCFTLLFIRYMITDIFAVNMFIQCAFTLHSNTKQSSISDEKLRGSYCHLVFQIFTAQSALTPPKCSQDFQSRAIGGDRWHLAPCASLHILCTCVSFKWCEPSKLKNKKKNLTLLNRTPRTSNEATQENSCWSLYHKRLVTMQNTDSAIHHDEITMLGYSQPSRYKDDLQSTELLILATLSVWGSQIGFPETIKSTTYSLDTQNTSKNMQTFRRVKTTAVK